MVYAPTIIDLSRVPAPDALESLSHQVKLDEFINRFKAFWAEARAVDPTLPDYDVQMLETDPAVIIGQAWTYLRLLDRQRVNDAVKSVLAPLAKGADLDNVVARQNVQRLVIVPATATTPAVMESDEQLLRRYLREFDRPSAGSADRFLAEAWKAWPGMLDARVNGHAVHGRRGDTDVVIIGPSGRLATAEEKAAVRTAVTAPHVQPEAISVAVFDATRREYAASLVIEIAPGPDASIIQEEALHRVEKAGESRMLIGGELPDGFLAGSAYGPNVIRVRDLAPVIIPPDPYTVPVLTSISIAVEVRS